MGKVANVDIKIKGQHHDILEAAMFLKTHYEMSDFKETEGGDKLFAYIEQSVQLSCDEAIRQLVNQLVSIVPNVSLSAVGIWENQEDKEYQDFFYKYKNGEFYFQTSDIYGKEEISEEMTYEEFLESFGMNPEDEDAISKEEFLELVGNEVYMSASAEYVDDID